ncbi:MAG: hypothetical protein KJO49_08960 [Bacteroidia bacterium]|nr:hypothetical protein [Bacteroidia bacterium]MBT8269597.1 hypothetical protein [Bacteroidia bacterium]NNK69136.1 hypothetical protein [Flavobacteriaceae bacterium]
MNKIFYIKSCNTCLRIINDLKLPEGFIFRDIKEDALTVSELNELMELAGSYQALFSRRAKLYKEMGLKDLDLSEADYKYYILDHYTFLKRPVIVFDKNIFIGNSKAVTEKAYKAIHAV